MAEASGKPPAELKDAKRRGMQVHGRRARHARSAATPCAACSSPTTSWQYCPTCQTGGKLLADRRLSRLLK